jgi:hypothetical protein
MGEGEVESVRRAIEDLSRKTEAQHQDNQRTSRKDREAFLAAMTQQRDLFQEALNKQFLEHMELVRSVDKGFILVELCVGTGKPGEGRLGQVEETVEMLKKFRWQALALLAAVLWLADKIRPAIGH